MAVITRKQGTLEYLAAENIAVPHSFTTRLGGVSTGYLQSLNIGMNRGDEPGNVVQNFARLSETLGFLPENLVLTNQMHTDIVRLVTKADHQGLDHRNYPVCDALITQTPGTALTVFTADCTPILLWDRENGAVGAAHAGWRGTAMDIAGKTVRAMQEHFGCHSENLCAAIGPNIAQCCFETDNEVPQAMLGTYGKEAEEFIRVAGDKFYVNLKEINALALRRAGVENIAISRECTMCQPEKYWSHRYTRGVRGSQGAIICCEEAKK